MQRRDFLKIAFGCAAGLATLAASAEALALPAAPFAGDRGAPAQQNAQPAVTSSDEVDRLKPEEVRWGHHWHGHWRHRHWGWRRHHWGWHRHHWHRHWRRW